MKKEVLLKVNLHIRNLWTSGHGMFHSAKAENSA